MNLHIEILLICLAVVSSIEAGKKGQKHMKCKEEMKKVFDCCDFNKQDDETMTQCEEKFKSSGEKKWKTKPCIFECFFKEKGALDDTGKIDKEKIIEIAVKNAGGDADWEIVMKASAETCFEKHESMKERMNGKPPRGPPSGSSEEMQCNPEPMFLSMCIMTENVKNCPAAKWKDEEECNAAKTKMDSEECQRGPPPPPKE